MDVVSVGVGDLVPVIGLMHREDMDVASRPRQEGFVALFFCYN